MNRLSLVLKAIVVAFLSLLLLIPLMMVNGTIQDRQNYREQAVQSVAQSFAGPQSLAGPVLVVPYVDTVQITAKDTNGKDIVQIKRKERHWTFFPKTLALQGELRPDIRKLGLHEVRVYELRSTLDAGFDLTLPTAPSDDPAFLSRAFGQPYLSFAIADVRGLAGTPELTINGAPLALSQGLGSHRAGSGLHAPLGPIGAGQRQQFSIRLQANLAGTESLSIAPIADSNRISLSSAWPHPQFSGSFLPRSRRIGADGFQAQWDISSLAAGTQGQYGQGSEQALDALSVSLVEPVNIYSQADRASKYGFLFVALTFVGFFMFELIKRWAFHPILYGLVGLALAIFFLLLLSLSEHWAFWQAYLIAASACIGLLGVYLSAVLKSRGRGLGFATMLTLLYAALYGLLISEDNALVLGSLMLFAILAAIMLITRKIDWYALAASPPPLPAPDPAMKVSGAE
jgi:inner membrane protein